MLKKDREEQIRNHMSIFESPEEYPDLDLRLNSLEIAIKEMREYIKEYKKPYKHTFMGISVGLRDIVLDELENCLKEARERNAE